MGTTRQNASGKQQKYLLPAVAFDDAQFEAYRMVVNTNHNSVKEISGQLSSLQTSAGARETASPAAAVFAGMTAKLNAWCFAEDSWRAEEAL